jgi:hypothetical protein
MLKGMKLHLRTALLPSEIRNKAAVHFAPSAANRCTREERAQKYPLGKSAPFFRDSICQVYSVGRPNQGELPVGSCLFVDERP